MVHGGKRRDVPRILPFGGTDTRASRGASRGRESSLRRSLSLVHREKSVWYLESFRAVIAQSMGRIAVGRVIFAASATVVAATGTKVYD